VTDHVPGDDQGSTSQGVPGSLRENLGEVQANIPVEQQGASQAAGKHTNRFFDPSKILRLPGEIWNRIKNADNNRVIAVATVFIAAATVVTGYEAYSGSKQTDKMISAANIQAGAATRNANSADAMAMAAGKQADSMDKLAAMERQINRAKVSVTFIGANYSETQRLVWARVELQNDGAVDAKFISVFARAQFRTSPPKQGDEQFGQGEEFHVKPFPLPPLTSTNKKYATSDPIYLKIIPTDIRSDRSQGFYVWGYVASKDILGNLDPVPFCRYTAGNVIMGGTLVTLTLGSVNECYPTNP
jgi:hypothetical protein